MPVGALSALMSRLSQPDSRASSTDAHQIASVSTSSAVQQMPAVPPRETPGRLERPAATDPPLEEVPPILERATDPPFEEVPPILPVPPGLLLRPPGELPGSVTVASQVSNMVARTPASSEGHTIATQGLAGRLGVSVDEWRSNFLSGVPIRRLLQPPPVNRAADSLAQAGSRAPDEQGSGDGTSAMPPSFSVRHTTIKLKQAEGRMARNGSDALSPEPAACRTPVQAARARRRTHDQGRDGTVSAALSPEAASGTNRSRPAKRQCLSEQALVDVGETSGSVQGGHGSDGVAGPAMETDARVCSRTTRAQARARDSKRKRR